MWYDTLADSFGCDESFIMGVILLSKYSPAGYEAANAIIGKMVKARNDGRSIPKPSAYLSTSVERARRKLNPEGGELYAGLGGWADDRAGTR